MAERDAEGSGVESGVGSGVEPTAEERRARRARLDRVFGQVLPEQTSDDAEPGEAPQDESAADAWLRRQVPPHHG